jgi:hypothetical protein
LWEIVGGFAVCEDVVVGGELNVQRTTLGWWWWSVVLETEELNVKGVGFVALGFCCGKR